MRPWAIAEDQVKVAVSAGRVEVAFSLSKWPLAPIVLRRERLGTTSAGRVRVRVTPSVPAPWRRALVPEPGAAGADVRSQALCTKKRAELLLPARESMSWVVRGVARPVMRGGGREPPAARGRSM